MNMIRGELVVKVVVKFVVLVVVVLLVVVVGAKYKPPKPIVTPPPLTTPQILPLSQDRYTSVDPRKSEATPYSSGEAKAAAADGSSCGLQHVVCI